MNPEEEKLKNLEKIIRPHQQLLGQASDSVLHQEISPEVIVVGSETLFLAYLEN